MAKVKRKVGPVKKAAWDLFSKFIRLRDCMITTDSDTWGACITCGRLYPITKLQAGHFIPGRNNSILFDEQCVHAQCYGCNCCKNGNGVEYYKAMLELYGQEKIDALRMQAKTVISLRADDCDALKVKYREEIKRLRSGGWTKEEERLRGVFETSDFFMEQLKHALSV